MNDTTSEGDIARISRALRQLNIDLDKERRERKDDDQIMAWFGPGSNWADGKVPLLKNIWYYLALWKVPRKTESSGGSIFGYG
jgi:hypothetical protein